VQMHGAVQVKRLRPFSQMMVQRISPVLALSWKLLPALPLVRNWFRFCPFALTFGFSGLPTTAYELASSILSRWVMGLCTF
jgi:hypothetical protein